MLGKPVKILLGYDSKSSIIGIVPIHKDSEEFDDTRAFTFAERERNGYIRLGNRDFVKYIFSKSKLDRNKTQRFVPEWDAENKILLVNLDEPLDSLERDDEDDPEEERKDE